MNMTFSLTAIAAFRRHINYHANMSREQVIHMYGSIALALIIWKLIEKLLIKFSKKLDKKTCSFIGSSAALLIVMVSVLFSP